MSYKISKELFEVVMGIEICKIEVTGVKINYEKEGQFQEDDEIKFLFMSFTININDFFFKCKEWAFEQAYQLESCKTNKLLEDNKFESIYMCGGFYQYSVIQNFYASSEQQAVFDACQWILDKGKQ